MALKDVVTVYFTLGKAVVQLTRYTPVPWSVTELTLYASLKPPFAIVKGNSPNVPLKFTYADAPRCYDQLTELPLPFDIITAPDEPYFCASVLLFKIMGGFCVESYIWTPAEIPISPNLPIRIFSVVLPFCFVEGSY